jgi:hypothetical protein
VDIVITKDNFQTLADVVIADLTRPNLVQRASMMTTHASTIVARNKAQSYIERALEGDFIPLAIETYDCLHPCFDSFFTFCVHVYIARHQQTSLVPSMFMSHYRQQVLIALQRAQTITIV